MGQSTNSTVSAAERKEVDWGRVEGTNNVKVCVQVWFNKSNSQLSK